MTINPRLDTPGTQEQEIPPPSAHASPSFMEDTACHAFENESGYRVLEDSLSSEKDASHNHSSSAYAADCTVQTTPSVSDYCHRPRVLCHLSIADTMLDPSSLES